MKVLRLVSLVVVAFGAVLALSMFALMQYALLAHPNDGAVILPPLLLMLGLAVAAVGLVLLAIALVTMYLKNRQFLRSGR